MTDFITCSKCGEQLPLSEAITHELEERLEGRVQRALAGKEAEFEARLASELAQREGAARRGAQQKVAAELADLGATVQEKDEGLREARSEVLAVRKEKRELEDRRESLELVIARRVAKERSEAASQATARVSEEHQLALREKELQLAHMRQQIEDLKRASEQTRPGLQGEVLVREVEDLLRERWPTDQIKVVKAGSRGADIVQTVRSFHGHDCGKILWESKRAKHWSNDWISKLKEDQESE